MPAIALTTLVAAEPLQLLASTPSPVAATTAPGQYVYIPQTLQRVGTNRSLLCSIQSDSDGLHPAGWTGRQFVSADDGATWDEVPQPNDFPWLVKQCVASNDRQVDCLS